MQGLLSRDVLKAVRRIQIRTRRIVSDIVAGEFRSVFKGSGIEFDAVREYQLGDDVRSIDWNVTARSGRPYVKTFMEEREQTVMLLVDASASCQFGTARFKSELAAELCAVLAFSAIENGDKVGLILFTDQVEQFVPPKKGVRHGLRVVRDLLNFQPEHRGTRIAAALEHVAHMLKRRAILFLVSDFHDETFEQSLRLVKRRHDLIAVRVTDPREHGLAGAGILQAKDAETGAVCEIDLSSRRVRAHFERAVAEREARLKRLFAGRGVDVIDVRTDRPYVEPLIAFFEMRGRRVR
jgi:uncharacterized protein (DUF58 family)